MCSNEIGSKETPTIPPDACLCIDGGVFSYVGVSNSNVFLEFYDENVVYDEGGDWLGVSAKLRMPMDQIKEGLGIFSS